MTTIRVIVVVSVIVQAVVVALLFKTPVFPVACAVVAFASLFVRPRWQTTGRTISVASIVIAIGLTILWPVISPGVLTRAILLSLDVACFVSFLALAMQTLLLFSVDEEKRALRTVLIGTMSLGCAGSLLVQAYSWDAYRIGSAAFVIICAVLLRVSIRNRVSNPRDSLFIRRLAVTVTVASALILATSTSVIVKRYQQELDMIFANMVAGAPPGVSMGFPSSSRLGSIASLQRRQGQETAIRVLSEHQPGYLRGRACDTYSAPDSRWLTTSADAPVVADAVLAGVRERDPQGRAAILLRRPASSNYERMDIWPVSDMGAVVFTRLDASDVAVDAQRIEVDADINVLAPDMDPALSYALSAGPPVAFPRASLDQVSADTPLDERGFQRLTAVPNTVDPRIRELARSLFEGLTTTEEKIAAVVRYFRGNYTYQFGISVPPNEDPLTYFLIERPPAHCEYFASGAVILLRLGGIPARYVTGYVVHERNDIGDFWFARNRDAHAWAEAYIDQIGWVTVEATVTAGVPTDTDTPTDTLSKYRDAIRFFIASIRDAIARGDWRTSLAIVLRTIARALSSSIGVAILLALVLYLAVRFWRARKPRVKLVDNTPPELKRLHTLLLEMDRWMHARRLQRDPAETIHAYAERIRREHAEDDQLQRAAKWYEQYSSLRFCRTWPHDHLQALEKDLPR